MTANPASRALSLAALTVLELSPPEMVNCAADAGYSHVGLRLLPATPEEPVYPVIGDTPMVREIARRLASTGVAVLDIEILRLKPTTKPADYLPVLETGARLGARHVLVAGNDADEARLVTNFAELAALAAPLGLSLVIEPMPWTDVREFRAALRVIETSGARNAGILIDAIHFDRVGNVALGPRVGSGLAPALRAALRCSGRASHGHGDAAAPGPCRTVDARRRRPRPGRPVAGAASQVADQRRSADAHARENRRCARARTAPQGEDACARRDHGERLIVFSYTHESAGSFA